MKLFGLFEKTATRHVRNTPTHATQPDAQAITTSKKIDAIEYEMSAEFSTDLSTPGSNTSLPNKAGGLRQAIEEAAILFSSGQPVAARELLTAALGGDDDPEEKLAWRMLLELDESEGNQRSFDQRALAYAQRFETSPPPWQETNLTSTQIVGDKLPALSFRGKLTMTCLPMLEQLFQLGCSHRRFRLEFVNVSEADLAGCSALLQTLDAWRQQACEVHLAKGEALTEKIRGLIQTGRRDKDDAGWRLLIETLWLMQAAAAYETVCIDYSMTYEVSPPAPRSIPPPSDDPNTGFTDQAFAMPASIDMPVDALLRDIDLHAQNQERIVLNCLTLQRVDFNAAAPLIKGLNRLADIKPVELRHTSFLVSVLLELVGGHGKLKMMHRKT